MKQLKAMPKKKVQYCEQIGCKQIATRMRLKTNSGLKWFCKDCRDAYHYFGVK